MYREKIHRRGTRNVQFGVMGRKAQVKKEIERDGVR